MGLSIASNATSLGVQRHLYQATSSLQRSSSRLSSGLRIATAADDAAGLGISERMRARISSLQVSERNIQDGISLVQVAESALGEVGDIVSRIHELALQAQSGTLNSDDRSILTVEYDGLVEEMSRIINDTEFNGVQLLNSSGSLDIQVGTEASQDISVDTSNLAFFPVVFNFFSLDTTGAANTVNFLTDFTADFVSSIRGNLGATQNRLESAMRSTMTARESLSSAESRIRDVDVAEEMSNLTRAQILQQGATSVLAQANSQPAIALQLLG